MARGTVGKWKGKHEPEMDSLSILQLAFVVFTDPRAVKEERDGKKLFPVVPIVNVNGDRLRQTLRPGSEGS